MQKSTECLLRTKDVVIISSLGDVATMIRNPELSTKKGLVIDISACCVEEGSRFEDLILMNLVELAELEQAESKPLIYSVIKIFAQSSNRPPVILALIPPYGYPRALTQQFIRLGVDYVVDEENLRKWSF